MTHPDFQPVATRLQSDDPDEIAGALMGGEFEYLPIAGEPYSATLRALCLGPLVLQAVDDGPHIARGAFRPGVSGFLLPMRMTGELPLTVNGVQRPRANALLIPSGAELRARAPTRLAWVATAMASSEIEELTELAPMSRLADQGVSLIEATPRRMARLAGALNAAITLPESHAEALSVPGSARSLAESLTEMVQVTLTPDAHVLPRRRATREAVRVVCQAEEFLEANLARPIFRDELCTAIGVSRRKLHDAFMCTVGLTPPAYLKLRRLVLVRRALRAAHGNPLLIKSVALAHGFWHLGYFAQDYRALFGELPSETTPREARRVHDGVDPRTLTSWIMPTSDTQFEA